MKPYVNSQGKGTGSFYDRVSRTLMPVRYIVANRTNYISMWKGVYFSMLLQNTHDQHKLASYDKDFFLIGRIYPLSGLRCTTTCFVFRALRVHCTLDLFILCFVRKYMNSLGVFTAPWLCKKTQEIGKYPSLKYHTHMSGWHNCTPKHNYFYFWRNGRLV